MEDFCLGYRLICAVTGSDFCPTEGRDLGHGVLVFVWVSLFGFLFLKPVIDAFHFRRRKKPVVLKCYIVIFHFVVG